MATDKGALRQGRLAAGGFIDLRLEEEPALVVGYRVSSVLDSHLKRPVMVLFM
jgi:hypothetical protein